MTWEEAVRWYRRQPNSTQAIRDNYFDLPVLPAAERYAASEEFREVQRLLGAGQGRTLLDVGAGNGIASFAFMHDGWKVTALEPDPSNEVGAGAIEQLAEASGLPVRVVREVGEHLPFSDAEFSAIHARQVLHHFSNLEAGVEEIARVLIPGGLALITREHVADDAAQLASFLRSHPLHALYDGENAYPQETYLHAFRQAGLETVSVWSPLTSILNYHPGTATELAERVRRITRGGILGHLLGGSAVFRQSRINAAERRECPPGRLYSFLMRKPIK